MPVRIACLALACGLTITGYVCAADDPSLPAGITVVHDLPYRGGPSRQWRLDLAMPTDRGGEPRPAIVVIHGGGWLEGDKSSFASREHGVPGNIVDFATLGFVAVTINYRLSGEAPFPAALEDCQCAVRWLRAHAKEYHVDPERIGAYGNSAGGHLALLLGMVGQDAGFEGEGPFRDQSSRVQAVVSDSGPIDLFYQDQHNQLRRVVRDFLGGPPEGGRLDLYRKASPAHHIAPGVPPLLLLYGVTDEQVPVETADRFVVALDRAGLKDVSYYRLASVGHCPHSLVRIPVLRAVVEGFFQRTLKHPKPVVVPSLDLPPRPANAPKGSEFAPSITDLPLKEREGKILAAVLAGNIPAFLRTLVPIKVGNANDRVTYFVAPDYLAIGSDDDSFLCPLTPYTAQRIADRLDCMLPTPKMVDDIYANAAVKRTPLPIPPSPAMTTMPVFLRHNAMVLDQPRSQPLGVLVAGHKKDVVIANTLLNAPGKVAIYGWHKPDGRPIQPLYTGHTASWADYSHGIRLVARRVLVNGEAATIDAVLADPRLAPLLSREGVMHRTRYELSAFPDEPRTRRP